jgi:hypothetical protein
MAQMRRYFWCAAVLMIAVGCGKKGPPLSPIVRVPDAVGAMQTRRIGDDVFLTFSLPAQNVDRSTPVDIGRVEVYGYTGMEKPLLTRFTDVGTLVASVEIDADAGVTVTLRDRLAAGDPAAGPALVRYYLAVPFSTRGRAGPPSAVLERPLTAVPGPPRGVRVEYSADAAIVTWDPSRVLGAPRAAAPRAAPAVTTPPPEAIRYNVYLAPAERRPDTAPVAPVPVNPAPLETSTFTTPLQLDARRRCYSVGAVRGEGPRAVESLPSVPVCITPVDTFPPAPPSGVSAIAVDGAISLIWEANQESDLSGYVVLRGEAGDDTLAPVTSATLTETRFADRDIRPGIRYVYAVIALDRRQPQPNVSAQSERVEITAR